VPTTFPAPDLSDAAVLRFVAGLRPCRHGGLRLEAERLAVGGRTLRVVHQYGHGGSGISIALGTAEAATALARGELGLPPDTPSTDAARAPVVVLGGGVVGLSTARDLARLGHPVRLVAEKFDTATTSAVAGAQWLPVGIDYPPEPAARARFNAICRRGFDRLEELRRADAPGWGLEMLPVFELRDSEHLPHYFESGSIVPPRPLERLPFAGEPTPGRTYETMYIHTPRLLRRLRAEGEAMGVSCVEARVGSLAQLAEVAGDAEMIVNCLGLGSGPLFGDGAVYPAKGMLVHMCPQKLGYIFHDGYRYMFPREDALVLGGCFLPGNADPSPDPAFCARILENHRAFWAGRG
jgi:glycine/D-amino acid oxidase-like deaminating enzyme